MELDPFNEEKLLQNNEKISYLYRKVVRNNLAK